MGALRNPRRFFMFLLPTILLLTGCNKQDAECLTHIGQKMAAALGETKDSLNVSWQGVVPAMGLEARVAARLHWDKSLSGAAIEIKVNNAEVELNGTVQDQSQSARAGELAEATTGVEKVVNSLRVNSEPEN